MLINVFFKQGRVEVIGNYEQLSDNVMLNFTKKSGQHHEEETAPIIEEVQTTNTTDVIAAAAISHQPVVQLK